MVHFPKTFSVWWLPIPLIHYSMCESTPSDMARHDGSATTLFFICSFRSDGSTWSWMRATAWRTTTVNSPRSSTLITLLQGGSCWPGLLCKTNYLSCGRFSTSFCPPFSRAAALLSSGLMPLLQWLERRYESFFLFC